MNGPLAALRLAQPVLRADLRSMIECGALADAHRAPKPYTLEAGIRPHVERNLTALRACETALGERHRNDDDPAWLDDVIDGRLAL